MVTMQQIIDVLKTCNDPELNTDIWTLELIYGIEIKATGVDIKMTFTTPACPYGPALIETTKEKLREIKDIGDINIEIVFVPMWQPSEDVKAMFGIR